MTLIWRVSYLEKCTKSERKYGSYKKSQANTIFVLPDPLKDFILDLNLKHCSSVIFRKSVKERRKGKQNRTTVLPHCYRLYLIYIKINYFWMISLNCQARYKNEFQSMNINRRLGKSGFNFQGFSIGRLEIYKQLRK